MGRLSSDANELGALIAGGTKTATCSALWEHEAEEGPLPETGVRTIVLDGNVRRVASVRDGLGIILVPVGNCIVIFILIVRPSVLTLRFVIATVAHTY